MRQCVELFPKISTRWLSDSICPLLKLRVVAVFQKKSDVHQQQRDSVVWPYLGPTVISRDLGCCWACVIYVGSTTAIAPPGTETKNSTVRWPADIPETECGHDHHNDQATTWCSCPGFWWALPTAKTTKKCQTDILSFSLYVMVLYQ